MNNQWIEMFMYRTLGMAPTFAVMLIGAILAARNLNLYPRVCWALLGALALTAFNNLGMPMLQQIVMQSIGGFSPGRNQILYSFVMVLPYSLIGAAAWGLILYAIFVDRVGTLRYPPEEDPDRDILDR